MRRKIKLAATLAFAAGALTFYPPEASGSCFRCCYGYYPPNCHFCGCWEQTPSGVSSCTPSDGCNSWCGGCQDICGSGQSEPCYIS